jgi:hypothetical protein
MWRAKFITVALAFGAFLFCLEDTDSQGQSPAPPPPQDPALIQQAPPAVPNGVDVQARGPLHEAFAAPASEPQVSPIIRKQPPAPLDEMPPEERPEGNMVWIGGYYQYDDDRQDYLWVSGCWRAKPQGREWVPGYWREEQGGWQWTGGFWAVATADNKIAEINYQPAPPAPPAVAPPGDPPAADAFYVPGNYVYVDGGYRWRAGFWTHGQPGFVYIPAYYRWTIRGYIFVPGHWDVVMARRGLVYAPVVVNVGLIGPRFVYTPGYAINVTYVNDAMFIRPAYCHYYYGDYYGPVYAGWGFESCLIYSRRCYDPYVCYMRWSNPGWFNIQIGLYNDRWAGRGLPPRRLADVNFRVNTAFIGPGRAMIGIHGGRAVALAHAERVAIRDHAVAVRNAVHAERRASERPGAGPGVHRVEARNIPATMNHGPVPKGPATKAPPPPQKHSNSKEPHK